MRRLIVTAIAVILLIAIAAFRACAESRAYNSIPVPAASYTTSQSGADQTNTVYRRLVLIVNVTSAGTGSISPILQVKDPATGNYFTVWTAATALTANGAYAYYFSDAASGGSFTEIKAFGVPGVTWRAGTTANNSNAMTYSMSAQALP